MKISVNLGKRIESSDLKNRTVSALTWSFIESIGAQGVRFIIGIILARLLLPEQFGLIAIMMVFLAVSQSFIDSGFRDALIQKISVDQVDTCSIFYFNIGIGILATTGLFIAAPLIANFFEQAALTGLARVLSIIILINSLSIVQDAIITRALNFKIKAQVSLISGTLSGILGIILAYLGYGVWSLAAQQVSLALIRTLTLWLLNSWRPALTFSLEALRGMFGFGSKLLLSDILRTFFDQIYFIVIGKLFTAADLGFFTRAKTLQELPSNTLAQMVGRVTFPVFASIQDDKETLKKGFKKSLRTLVIVNFPMMTGLALIAKPLVLWILTEKWEPCVIYLQLFCFIGLLYPVHLINLNILLALGKSDTFLRLEIIKKLLVVLNIAITWQRGIIAIISGMMAISVISFFLNAYYTRKMIDYTIPDQLMDLAPYALVSALMGSVVLLVGTLSLHSNGLLVGLQVLIGILVYIGVCYVFRLREFFDLFQLLRVRFGY